MAIALPIFNIHDVVLFITVAVSLLLAVFQFFYPHKNTTAKYFLVLFLVCIAVGVTAVLIFWLPAIKIDPVIDNQIIPYILFISLLLKGPLLYSYVSCSTTEDYKFTVTDAVHLLPVVIYFFTLFASNSPVDDTITTGDKLLRALSHYDWHSVKIIPLIYAAMATYKVYQYDLKTAPRYPAYASDGPVWLALLTWGFLFNWCWSLGTHLLGFYAGAPIANPFGILDNYITAGLVSALLIYSLINANKQLSTSIDAHGIGNNAENPIVEKIIHCMETEKLFLNPRLNIERMAEHIKVPYRELSALINQHFHANFNEYINVYRINEAKRLLSDTHSLNLPINEIYVQAGFNSKSAFHRFFNRLVGISPSEYRKLSAASVRTDNDAAHS